MRRPLSRLGATLFGVALAGYVNAQNFTGADLGTPGLPGSATKNPDGTITLVGGGADIWGTADSGYFYYTTVSAPVWDAVVRVRDLQGDTALDGGWTKCELMVRQTDATGAVLANYPFIANMTTRAGGQNEIADQFRATIDGNCDWVQKLPPARPSYPNTWLRLQRQGSVFTVWYGTDGTNWSKYIDIDTAKTDVVGKDNATTFGSPWPYNVQVGIALTAHADGSATGGIATISDLKVTTQQVQAPTAATAITQVQNATAPEGSEVTFSFLATNNAAPNVVPMVYQWYKNDQAAPFAVTKAIGEPSQFTFLAGPGDNNAKVYCKATCEAPYGNVSVYSSTGAVTVLPATVFNNGLKWEWFKGKTRQQVEDGNTGPADMIAHLSSFETPVNYGGNYASRVSGYFIAPQSGSYVFYLAADDDADLFLSTDANPANKRLIAQEAGWSGSRNYLTAGLAGSEANKRSDSFSPDGGTTMPYAGGISLTANQKYYIEAVQRQGGGGDSLAVTYRLTSDPEIADGDAPKLSAANNNIALLSVAPKNLSVSTEPQDLSVFAGQDAQFSLAIATDSELQPTYQWYKNGAVMNGATANNLKFQTVLADNGAQFYAVVKTPLGGLVATSRVATLSVKTPVFEPGMLKVEFWSNQGSKDPVLNGTAPEPDYVTTSPAFEASQNGESGANYTRRMSGYFIPPSTGNYVFFVTSDDDSNLYLSTDDTPAGKQLIAQETTWSGVRTWQTSGGGGNTAQKRSDQFVDAQGNPAWVATTQLVAGRKYYIEAVQHEGGGGDNLGATYMKVGDNEPQDGEASRLTGNVIGFNAPSASVAFSQQPQSVSVQPGTTATFSVAATTDSKISVGVIGAPVTDVFLQYQWYKNGTAIPGAVRPTYTTPMLVPADNGAKFTCAVKAVGSTWSNSEPAVVTLAADSAAPTVVSAFSYVNANVTPNLSLVDISFSEAMDAASLQSATYTVAGATVTSVVVNTNNYRTVQLTVSGTPTGAVTVSGAKDMSGNAIAANSSLSVSRPALTSLDIGNPGDPAFPSMIFVDGPNAYTIMAEGSDIWNNADGFNFTYEEKTGDFDVVVRQKSITHTSNWAKGGLMARETLTPGSRNWNVVNDPLASDGIMAPDNSGYGANMVECNSRVETDGVSAGYGTAADAWAPAYPNAWVRLQRRGNVLNAFASANGVDWSLRGTQDAAAVGSKAPLPAKMYVGICVTAHNNDTDPANLVYVNTSTFDSYNSSFVPQAGKPTLQASVQNGKLAITWSPAGGHLEATSALPGGTWAPVADPANIPVTDSAKFFRVVVP